MTGTTTTPSSTHQNGDGSNSSSRTVAEAAGARDVTRLEPRQARQGRETRNGDNQGAQDVTRLEPWCFFSFSLFTTTSTTTHYNHNDGKFPGGGVSIFLNVLLLF